MYLVKHHAENCMSGENYCTDTSQIKLLVLAVFRREFIKYAKGLLVEIDSLDRNSKANYINWTKGAIHFEIIKLED